MAPASLAQQFIQLPASLWPLASVAHVQGLAAACSPHVGGSDLGKEEDVPVLTICVDTTASVVASPRHLADMIDDHMSKRRIWSSPSEYADDSESDEEDHYLQCNFKLHPRIGAIPCSLRAKSWQLADMTVSLPSDACLMIGSLNRGMHVRNVTFQGMQRVDSHFHTLQQSPSLIHERKFPL
jgi:hypothetical protein